MALSLMAHESKWEDVPISSSGVTVTYLKVQKNEELKRVRVSGFITVSAISTSGVLNIGLSNVKPIRDTAVALQGAGALIMNGHILASNGTFQYRSTAATTSSTDVWISGEWDI